MRILQVNKFYFEQGGAERYMFALSSLLETHGHDVIPFAMASGRDKQYPLNRYFVSKIITERPQGGWEGLRTVGRVLWSREAATKLDALLTHYPIDIAHLHNIYHQISPSILPVLKKHGIPIVMTLHDFHLVSPAYNLYAHGGYCEHAKGSRFFNSFIHRCVKSSYFASAVCAFELWIHHTLRLYERYVDAFIVPSEFMARTLQEWGFQPRRLEVIPNFIDAKEFLPTQDIGDAMLYVGRLSEEKGIHILLESVKQLPDVSFIIAGSGPLERLVRDCAANCLNLRFLGQVPHCELARLYVQARAVIVPSLACEVFPMVILEAGAAGRPVIAFDKGGINEIIEDGYNGKLISNEHDNEMLLCAIKEMEENMAHCLQLGINARTKINNLFNTKFHINKIIKLYSSLL
ncbi:MAG: glycosyltransferase [Patescibacteria group bacterium]